MYIIIVCIMIAVALLFLLMIPIVFFFGLVGVSLKAVWAVFVFVLKYGAPAAAVGALIAKLLDKDYEFTLSDYLMHSGIAALAGVAIMLIGMQMQGTPDFPAGEDVTAMVVSYEVAGEHREQAAWEQYQIDSMCDSLSGLDLKRTVKEFIDSPENGTPYDVTFTLSDGEEVTCTFHSSKSMTLHTGTFPKHYKIRKGTNEIPIDSAENLFYEVKRIAADALLQPFADAFFESIHYDSEDGNVYFCIPEQLPEGDYNIRINITAVEFLEDGRENKLKVTPFEDEQKSGNWDPGHWYCFPLEEMKYITYDFKVSAPNSSTFTFDLMPQIPRDWHRYPF